MIALRRLLTCLLLFSIFSCSEEKEIFETDTITDYLPLAAGKSITYRLDSTVFAQSGSVKEIHKYQVRHTVLQESTDPAGHKTFLIQRLINNETGTGNWTNNGSYQVVLEANRAEVIQDNLRVVVLQAPFKQGFTWKGNSQLPFAPYEPLYEMGAGNTMNSWDFEYGAFGAQEVEAEQYQDVWSIEQHHETLNIPPTSNTSYGSMEVAAEKYARGIGLVYKNFQLYEYQGANAQNPSSHYIGFGIEMWMIAHN